MMTMGSRGEFSFKAARGRDKSLPKKTLSSRTRTIEI
jgi:hypothetical protein